MATKKATPKLRVNGGFALRYGAAVGAPRILLLPCWGNILLLRSEAGRTMSGREPTFLLAGCSALDTGTGRGVFA